jgi:hypothetical protein
MIHIHLSGNIMAYASITATAGSHVNGRLLARYVSYVTWITIINTIIHHILTNYTNDAYYTYTSQGCCRDSHPGHHLSPHLRNLIHMPNWYVTHIYTIQQ